MSGLFGVVDRERDLDPARVVDAARASAFRGDPIVRQVEGAVFGAYVRAGAPAPIEGGPDGLLVADARIDAFLTGSGRGGFPDRDATPPRVLAGILAAHGPTGLGDLAAEFALATWDPALGSLLLARDAFGSKPLYWAQRGARVAFASDAEVLVRLGMADGRLDRRSVAEYLCARDLPSWRSAFQEVFRVPGGRWISFRPGADVPQVGRWFRPETVEQEPMSLGEAGARARDAIVEAVRSRASGRVGLVLSGGRDSGSIAVALAALGVEAECFTFVVEGSLGTSEVTAARTLARSLGHRWHSVPVSSSPDPAHLRDLPDLGGPLGPPIFPFPFALLEAVARVPVDVLLDGSGGEPLFSAAPVVVMDLLRQRRFGDAVRASRGYDRAWTYPFGVQGKWIVRGMLPRRILALRERLRSGPSWVVGSRPPPVSTLDAPRTARDHLLASLIQAGRGDLGQLAERLGQKVGSAVGSPLLDLRVVRLALALPDALRAPVPCPKPVLEEALLGAHGPSRVKGRYWAYFQALAESIREHPMGLLGTGTLAESCGYVRGHEVARSSLEQQASAILRIVPLEMWLRKERAG